MFNLFSHKKKVIDIQEFAHAHSDLLIIVGNPKTDEISIHFRDKIVAGRIKSADGKDLRVVSNLMKASQFNARIDSFLVGIAEMLGLKKFTHGAHFFKFLDGALYNLAVKPYRRKKELKAATEAKKEEMVAVLAGHGPEDTEEGAIPSPYRRDDL